MSAGGQPKRPQPRRSLPRRQPIGAGWSAFAIVNGCAVTQEERDGRQMVTAYDAETGRLLWTHDWPGAYTHPMGPFTFTGKYRWHDQTGAHFFRDLFPRAQATNFRGRDKEISPLTSQTFTIMASWEFLNDPEGWGFLKRGALNFSYSLLDVDYHEFRDISTSALLGEEPLYQLEADIIQLFVSFWY